MFISTNQVKNPHFQGGGGGKNGNVLVGKVLYLVGHLAKLDQNIF